MNSAYYIVESPEQNPRLSSRIAPAYPVVSWRPGRNKIIPHLVPRTESPTKYRRPPKVDRGCFDGGSPLGMIRNLPSTLCDRSLLLPAVAFKATSQGRCFSQFDRNSGCYRKGAWLGRRQRLTCRPRREFLAEVSKRLGAVGRRTKKGELATPIRERVRPSFTVAAWGTQTRHGGSVVKYQPCSQSVLMVVRFSRVRIATSTDEAIKPSRLAGATFRALWQKPGIGLPLSVKSSPLIGMSRKGKGTDYPQGCCRKGKRGNYGRPT